VKKKKIVAEKKKLKINKASIAKISEKDLSDASGGTCCGTNVEVIGI
jgi:natural product precursor